MFDVQAVTLNADDLPSEIVDFMSRMDKMRERQQSVAFTLKDLSLISQGLDGLQRMLKHGIKRGVGETDALIDMLTDAKVLEKRVTSLTNDAFAAEFGPDFDQEAMATRLQKFAEEKGLVDHDQATEDKHGIGFGQYL